VVPAIGALLGETQTELIVGLPNGGRLPDVDHDVQIEGWTVVNEDGVHPRPLPDNTLCRQDVASFARTRCLAFAAVQDPRPETVGRFAEEDPLTRAAISHPDWAALLCCAHWRQSGK
jgi:alpha-galactosidase/6-phospho-beta-glucosidase family protein